MESNRAVVFDSNLEIAEKLLRANPCVGLMPLKDLQLSNRPLPCLTDKECSDLAYKFPLTFTEIRGAFPSEPLCIVEMKKLDRVIESLQAVRKRMEKDAVVGFTGDVRVNVSTETETTQLTATNEHGTIYGNGIDVVTITIDSDLKFTFKPKITSAEP